MNAYAFDNSPFSPIVGQSHEWSTDIRHIQMLHAIGVMFSPLGRIVEIGSFRGASTAALVSLLKAKRASDLVCVEPAPTDALKSVLSTVSARSLIIPTYPDYGPTPDFIFIDGDHGAPALKDIEWALTRLIPIICLHDINAVKAGYPACWGAVKAGDILAEHESYVTFEDKKPRPGERTERGFMVGIRDDLITMDHAQAIRELMKRDDLWWV